MGESKGDARETTDTHREAKNLEKICEEAWRMGIKDLTVYALPNRKLELAQENEVAGSYETASLNYMKTCLKTSEANQ